MTMNGTVAERSREVRLGLVMYGGVSLAIYIYGVAREFFNAVRGRGVFKIIKALTDSDIVVDVVSGTSAGGINGILLSYCLANEFEIGAAASTWRDQGGIAAMLRDPLRDTDPPSVLKGDAYFLKELEKTFERLKASKITPENAPADDPSEIREIDLFVTGTDVDGRITTRFDALNHAIDVKDHRVVFHLKHRARRKEQFRPGPIGDESDFICKALGKLARVTSSFPAAFEPVQIAGKPPRESPDGQLGYWAWGSGGTERNVFLADGGILDNKPFTPTIREIFHRTSEREVERWLFYVEPDPERFQPQEKVDEPNVLKVVFGSLSSIPSYESIADDLRRLDEHNDKVTRFRRLADYIRTGDGLGLDTDSLAFVDRWQAWEGCSSKDDVEPPKEAPLGSDVDPDERPSPYAQSRLVEVSERVVQGVLRTDGVDRQLSADERMAAEALLKAYDEWPGNGDFTLYNFDINFRLRRLFHLLYTCPKPRLGGGESAWQLARTRHVLNRQLKLLEVLRSALERLLDEGEYGWSPTAESTARSSQAQGQWHENLWRFQVADAFVFLLHRGDDILPEGYDETWDDGWPASDWLSTEVLEKVRIALMERVDLAKKYLLEGTISDHRPEPDDFDNVLMATDRCERRMLERFGVQETRMLAKPNGAPRTLGDEYKDFIRVDAVLFPLEAFSGLHERDVIKTVRISPLEARRAFSRRPLAEKVSGDSLAHFGGFLKKSWRSNDILWGRLDAVCQLCEALLVRDRVVDVVRYEGTRQAIKHLDVAALFPRSPKRARHDLKEWLEALASDDDAARDKALDEVRFGAMLELLIEAQQLEILATDVPAVIEDSISEQMEWNQFRLPGGDPRAVSYDPGTNTFYGYGGGSLDPLVVTAASSELAKQAAEDLKEPGPEDGAIARPRDTNLGRFFVDRYKVGAEALDKDIPTVVLLKVLSTTLLVTRNCLLAAFEKPRRDAIRRNWLYKLMSAALWGFDGAVALMSRGALQAITIVVVLAVAACAALYVGVTWWDSLIGTASGFRMSTFLLFIAVPLAVIGSELWLLTNAAWHEREGEEMNVFEERHPLGRIAGNRTKLLLFVFLALAVLAGALTYGDPGWQKNVFAQQPVIPADGAHWRMLLFDTLFIFTYTAFLSLSGVAVWRRLRAAKCVIAPLALLLGWIALVAGGIDLIENFIIAVVLFLKSVPGDCMYEPLAAVGRFCTNNKAVPPVAIGIGLLLLAMPLALRSLRRR